MIPDTLSYSYAFMLGLLSSAHCVGMCGGITAALTFGIPAENRTPLRTFTITVAYNIGRIITYTAMGLLLGSAAQFLQNHSALFALVLRTIAGIMLIIMGLYLSNIWQGLTAVEKIGQRLWRFIQPLSRQWLPVNNIKRALGLGIVWGFLPCGLVYSVLIWAVAANTVQQSAFIMFCFGLGTLPALVTLGLFSNVLRKFIQARSTRMLAGLLVIAFGIWTLIFAFEHGNHSEHFEHTEHAAPVEQNHTIPMDHLHH